MNTCARCGRQYEGIEGMIGDEHYCHGSEPATWPTPTPTVELRSVPGHPDAAIDVYLQLHGRNTALHGVSPDLAITLGADPARPILRIAVELVPELAAALRSITEALEAL